MNKPASVIEYEERMSDPAHELAVLESIFEQCQVAWWKGMQSLNTILEKELWKTGKYKTEEEYLRKRWNIGMEGLKKRQQYARMAEQFEEGLPEDVRMSHLASLGAYPPDMRKEIMETAIQTAPGGKVTAAWVEQTARRLTDARRAALRKDADDSWKMMNAEDDDEEDLEDESQADRAAGGDTAVDDDDDESDSGIEDSTEEYSPPPKRTKPTTEQYARHRSAKPGNTVLQDAVSHPIVNSDEIDKKRAQAFKAGVKLQRLVTDLRWMGYECQMTDFLPKD